MLQANSFKANNIGAASLHNSTSAPSQSRSTTVKSGATVKLPSTPADTVSHETSHKKNAACVSIATMKKMLIKFLFDKKMPKDVLAENLGVKPIEIDQILATKLTDELAQKISLALVTLYCKTKWN